MEKKYLKYKFKYLNLKNKNLNELENMENIENMVNIENIENMVNMKNIENMVGSNLETCNSLIVTHNSRLRCFLEDVAGDFFKEYIALISKNLNKHNTGKIKNIDEIRFKNCCILKICFQKDKVSIEMIYEGVVNNRKKTGYYFTNNLYSMVDIPFLKIDNIPLSKFNLSEGDLKKNYNFYIVRHGEGTHNINKNIIKIERDPVLTVEGNKQAIDAGKILAKENIKFDYLFSSKLFRTRETIAGIMNEIDKNSKLNIIILPCSHELNFFKNGKCDSNNKGKPIAFENTTSCNVQTCSIDKPNKCCIIGNFISDWTYYNTFYKENKHCSDTNMFKLAIEYIK